MTEDRAEVKRRAARLLRTTARTHLSDLGVTQVSSSPRQWIADRGWWLINIEFQASSWSVASYLNVGLQHLWTPQDYRSFGYSNRQLIPGHHQKVDLEGDEAALIEPVEALGRAARASVQEWLTKLGEDKTHLEWLTKQRDGAWNSVNAAFALCQLGKHKKAAGLLHDTVDRLDPDVLWQQDLAEQCRQLAALTHQPASFQTEATRRIGEARQLLKLPALQQ